MCVFSIQHCPGLCASMLWIGSWFWLVKALKTYEGEGVGHVPNPLGWSLLAGHLEHHTRSLGGCGLLWLGCWQE